MRFMSIKPLPTEILNELGFYWHETIGQPKYLADEVVVLTEPEGEGYYQAANELYDMFVEAGQHVIDNRLYDLLGIPGNLQEMIQTAWEDESHFHMVGRFDFAGGIDGRPIKMIEFNADTPSLIFETALIQWMMLKHNNMDETRQFNNLYEALKDSFFRLKDLHPAFGRDSGAIPSALFSCLDCSIEDENTTRLYEQIAMEAGFVTDFEYADKVCFSEETGVLKRTAETGYQPYDFWFKLIPYEYIGAEEPELAQLLTGIVKRRATVLLNPPYALLFQSKGFLKVLWDLFPGHPLLLDTAFEPLRGRRCVEKKLFGREGANVSVLDAGGNVVEGTGGDYAGQRSIYQEYVPLPADNQGRTYQAGVFFSYEACGLGFRREKGIIQDGSQFVGHFVG